MVGHGEKLSRRMEQTIAALLSESTLEAAAAKARISTRTLKKWLKLPEFLGQYRAARRAILEHAQGQIQGLTSAAVVVLRDLLVASDKDAVKARVALGILDNAVKAVELTDLAERVESLEAALKNGGRR
jgi:hypothetical protein